MSRTLVGSVSSTRTTLFVAPYCTVASRLVSSMDRISPNTHAALRSLRTITLPRDAFGTSGAAATANGPAAGVTHRASAAAASLSCAACIVAELEYVAEPGRCGRVPAGHRDSGGCDGLGCGELEL